MNNLSFVIYSSTFNFPLLYLTYFSLVFVFSILMNSLFLRFSKNLGARKNDTMLRWSDVNKPALGGITFFITFLLSIITYILFFEPSDLLMHSEVPGLLAACVVSFLAGLTDDAYNTNPLLKFSSQVFCAIILIYSGVYIQIFPNIYFNYFITMLWIVGLMNAINLLDNMDAIATIVSLAALLTMTFLLLIEKATGSVFFILMLGTASALFAFLFFNWHPSKMYMGDTGTQFLGVLMAALSIMFLWNNPLSSSNPDKRIISAILTFSLPIIDTTVVFFNRLIKGTSPFKGGKDHTTHHLFYLGLNEIQIAFLCIIYTSVCLSLVVLINKYILDWSYVYSIILASFFVLTLAAFFVVTWVKKSRETEAG